MDFLLELFNSSISYLAYLDTQLSALIFNHGNSTYVLLTFIIFAETALFITFFLPGDSLLLAAGALVGAGSLNFIWVILLLTVAAVAGNICNYWLGYIIGKKFFNVDSNKEPLFKFINKKHLAYTHNFYKKYGGLTIVISRFIPVFRAFAPLIAGISKMGFKEFSFYTFIGGILWVVSLILMGMLFGKIPCFQENTLLLIIIILLITFLILPFLWKIAKKLMKQQED